MTNEELHSAIDVLIAAKNGVTIEYTIRLADPQDIWMLVNATHIFNFQAYQYRIQPKSPAECICENLENGSTGSMLASFIRSSHILYSNKVIAEGLTLFVEKTLYKEYP